MKRELELKDIAGNFPYELYLSDEDFKQGEVYKMLGYEFDTTLAKIEMKNSGNEDWWNLSNFKPILRPKSDLYKPIIHNGEEIVPIVELARIAFPDEEWRLNPYEEEAVCGRENFYYYEAESAFLSVFTVNGHIVSNRIKNQYQLFDYLHELKIDYRGLIDAGLAVSVYDLSENPYK
jgi:hypothetical protein